ncbi:GTPase domain-containing protein [Campylobacter lari]|uniref:GTP binding protein n=1 Tax=Campylobacter lari NCTC 11845 TaxID=1388749 RepID=A0A0A8HSW5_CAMLA|nr:GTPase domain-containing protein [Campylobacter lari]AJD00932.1 GTP binding protein [Campylobacter lari NCTC 11845]EAK9954306.1 GTP-binding protein [Campylobacter lari]
MIQIVAVGVAGVALYKGGKYIYNNFINNKNVILVGESMAGKTTIFNILTKNFDSVKDEHNPTNTLNEKNYENFHFKDHGGSEAQIDARNELFDSLSDGDYVVYVFNSSEYNKKEKIQYGMKFWKNCIDEEKNKGKKINYIIIGTRAGETKKDIMNDIKQNISNAKVEIFELLGDQSNNHYKKIHKELMGLFE